MSQIAAAQIAITAKDRATSVLGRVRKMMVAIQARLQVMARHARRFLMVGGLLAVAGLKAFKDYELQLAMVSTMLQGDAMRWMPKYKAGVASLAVAVGESTKTLSKGLYDILSASVEPARALTMLRVAAEAAKGGFTNTAIAVDGLTSLLNAYGLSAKYAGAVSDRMFMTVKRGKLTFEQLAAVIGKTAPLARAAGMHINHMMAAIATMTRQGLSARLATTRLVAILRAMPEAGKDLFALVEKYKGLDLKAVMKDFPRIRAASGISALAADLKGFEKDLGLMEKAAGSRMEAFRKQQATFAAQWEKTKASLVATGRVIGKLVVPWVRDLSKWIARAVPYMVAWANANERGIRSAVKWAAGIAMTLIMLPKVIALLAGISKLMLFLVASPFGLVLTGLAAIAGAFMYAAGSGDTFTKRMIDGFWRIVKIADVMLGSMEGLRAGFGLLGNQAGHLLVRGFYAVKDWFLNLWIEISSAFKTTWKYSIYGLQIMFTALWGWLRRGWSSITEVAEGAVHKTVTSLAKAMAWVDYKMGNTTKKQYEDTISDKGGYFAAEDARMKKQADARAAYRKKVEAETSAEEARLRKERDEELAKLGQENMDEQRARELATGRKLNALDARRRKDLEAYLKKMEKLPRLSEKVRAIFEKLRKGLGFEAINKDLEELKKKEAEADLPPPVGGGLLPGEEGAKVRLEGLQATWKRIATAAATTESVEEQILDVAKQGVEVEEDIKAGIDEVKKGVDEAKVAVANFVMGGVFA